MKTPQSVTLSFLLFFPLLLFGQVPIRINSDSLTYLQQWAWSTQKHYQYYSVREQRIVSRLPKFRHFKDLGENRYSYAISYGHWTYGIKNTEGQIIVRPQFERIEPFRQGLAAVRYEGKWGLIDTSGNYVLPPVHRYGFNLKKGLIQASDTLGRLPVYDRTGKLLFYKLQSTSRPNAAYARSFSYKDYYSFEYTEQGYVLTGMDGSRRILKGDEQLRDSVLCLYFYLLTQEHSPSYLKDLPPLYDIQPINSEVYFLYTHEGVKYYNIAQNRYLDAGWQSASIDQERQHAVVGKPDKASRRLLMWIVDAQSNILIDTIYEAIWNISNDYYQVGIDGWYGIMDKNTLKLLCPLTFQNIKATPDPSLFMVEEDSTWKLFNINTGEMRTLKSGEKVDYQHGLSLIIPSTERQAFWVINKQGETILEIYEDIKSTEIKIDPAVIWVKSKFSHTLYNHQGELIGGQRFNEIRPMGKDYYYLGWYTGRLYDKERKLVRGISPFLAFSTYNQFVSSQDHKLIYYNVDGEKTEHSERYHQQLRPWLEKGQFAQAADLMQRAYQTNPYDAKAYLKAAHYRLMDSINRAEQIKLAIKEREEYAKIWQENYELSYLDCSIALASGQLEKALQIVTTELNKNDIHGAHLYTYLYLLEYLHRKLGREKALDKWAEELEFYASIYDYTTEIRMGNYRYTYPFISQLLQRDINQQKG